MLIGVGGFVKTVNEEQYLKYLKTLH